MSVLEPEEEFALDQIGYLIYKVIITRDPDSDGFFAAWDIDLEGTKGYGSNPYEAIACLCAILDQEETGDEQGWHEPFTKPRKEYPKNWPPGYCPECGQEILGRHAH